MLSDSNDKKEEHWRPLDNRKDKKESRKKVSYIQKVWSIKGLEEAKKNNDQNDQVPSGYLHGKK